ncbi:hypothetical protein CC85DRAFT_284330 [Cutaneotrichosporon oleaginosum]|uniref:Uncharacterized protein n=1 Tax=Cutaneotrichosporon oleaginosum TaxID=879819 RepID=A0A0J0XR98_9TREE|nr:uncharacterized protein CC85DRAFT_284330 [Cutaneotrichosporon oleaginosum]KLT43623.1 hypothetical protein CC85DRAFT_284330 [Cutaneotrichosporon oleaginosum]TXT12709.1 hypothetical protein COLE_03119 [Cutaneotrichosporon oleaginosum]
MATLTMQSSAIDLSDTPALLSDNSDFDPAATIRRSDSLYTPRRVGPPTEAWDTHPDWRGYYEFCTTSLPVQTLTRFTTSAVAYVSSTSIPRHQRPGWRVFFTEFYWTDERGLPQVMHREDLVAAFEKLVRAWELPPGAYDDLWALCAPHWGTREHKGDELIARLTKLQKERGALATCFSEQLELLRQMELSGYTPARFHASDIAYPISYSTLGAVSAASGRPEYTIPSAPEAEFVDGTVSDWVLHVARFVLLHDPPPDSAIAELEAEARNLAAELSSHG